MLWEFIERDKIMNMDIKQVDSLIKEVRGNVKFLGNLLGMALVFLGLVGVVGLLLGIAVFLR